jgi:Ca2+-binding RTX toxin-like protein
LRRLTLAAGHQCSGRPCIGTNTKNVLYERPGSGTSDAIYGRGGGDVLRANEHTRDRDRLYGNRGRDSSNVNDGDTRDTVSGGPGFDVCCVDSRSVVGTSCEGARVNR